MSFKRQPEMNSISNTTSFGDSMERSSVALQLLERIKSALIRGDLKPGDYLPSETELTHTLGIGKSSVREAIKMLQAIGIVEVKRGQGTMIRREPGTPLVDPMAFGMILARGMTRDVLNSVLCLSQRIPFKPCIAPQQRITNAFSRVSTPWKKPSVRVLKPQARYRLPSRHTAQHS